MYWIYYSLALSLHYLFYVILTKLLVDKYDFRKILINTYLIALLILISFYPKDIILKPDLSYLYIIIFALNIVFGAILWLNATKNKLNLGKMDGLATAIYLPILTVISVYLFKQIMNIENYIGIILIGFGAYLVLKE